MLSILNISGTICGVLGAFVCALSGLSRVLGNFYLANYETTTLFTAGTALMVFGCFLKLHCVASGGKFD